MMALSTRLMLWALPELSILRHIAHELAPLHNIFICHVVTSYEDSSRLGRQEARNELDQLVLTIPSTPSQSRLSRRA